MVLPLKDILKLCAQIFSIIVFLKRYIICENALETKETICKYLFNVNEKLNSTFRNENTSDDIDLIVPIQVMLENESFYNYIRDSNERMGRDQVFNLKKIQSFATNPTLHDWRQGDLIDECLRYWKIPETHTRIMYAGDQSSNISKRPFQRGNFGLNQPRQRMKIVSVPWDQKKLLNKFNNELKSSKLNWNLNGFATALTHMLRKEFNLNLLEETFSKCSILDYKCFCSCEGGKPVLLLGCGRFDVYEFEFNGKNEWIKFESFKLDLPKETLLLVEKVSNENKNEVEIHVIDAFFIEGKNMILLNEKKISSYKERHSHLAIFIKTISKKCFSNRLHLKEIVDIDQIENSLKDTSNNGVYFLKYINSPWSLVKSKRSGRKYFYNSDGQISTYEEPNDDFLFSDPK